MVDDLHERGEPYDDMPLEAVADMNAWLASLRRRFEHGVVADEQP